MVSLPKSLLLLTCMLIATSLGFLLKPTLKIAEQGARIDLESMIPKQFGDWHELTQKTAFIINPVQKEVLDNVYTQTLSRIYVNESGEMIMLSIAYGEDQRKDTAAHFPEICYPAQGFKVTRNNIDVLAMGHHSIPIRRLETQLGLNRIEPVTYWIVIGNRVVVSGLARRLIELNYGVKGVVPDGMVVRVSSINADANLAYAIQDKFIDKLFQSIDSENRTRIFGFPRY